ncbi:porin family protein [Cytophagaceae bacterium ABcell3]|nr:porin family protein [Cytophagaceae bacterium ABcell3]
MKYFLLGVLVAIALEATAQNQFIGIKGGVNHTNVNFRDLDAQPNFRTGVSAGMTYEYLLTDRFSLGVDLIYNQRGYTEDIILTDWNGNMLIHDLIRYNIDYASIPIKVGFNTGNKLYAFTNVGLIPSFLVSATLVEPRFTSQWGQVRTTGTDRHNITSELANFDLAGFAELGAGYKYMNNYWLFTSFSYQTSFNSFANPKHHQGNRITHYGMTLSVGMKYLH